VNDIQKQGSQINIPGVKSQLIYTEVVSVCYELLQTVAAYYPSSSGTETYGPFAVQLLTTDSTNSHVVVRDFVLSFNGKVK